jgi:hypothetical protein
MWKSIIDGISSEIGGNGLPVLASVLSPMG